VISDRLINLLNWYFEESPLWVRFGIGPFFLPLVVVASLLSFVPRTSLCAVLILIGTYIVLIWKELLPPGFFEIDDPSRIGVVYLMFVAPFYLTLIMETIGKKLGLSESDSEGDTQHDTPAGRKNSPPSS